MVRLRQIGFVLLMALLLAGCNTRALREAERTIAMADSLDACGQLYTDTLALQYAKNIFHNDREQKARACYWLARNYDKLGQFDKASILFIEAKRCQPKELILQGRINTNLAYYCSQYSADSLATGFYQQAVDCFKQAESEQRYAYALVSLSNNYGRRNMFNEADEVWQQASQHNIDSTYLMRLYQTKANTFYLQQEYDSAQIWLNKLPYGSSNNPYLCLLVARVYFERGLYIKAAEYAQKVLDYSPVDALKISAYYILENIAETNCQMERFVEMSHKRADAFKVENVKSSKRAVAVAQIDAFLQEEDNSNCFLLYAILGGVLLMIILIATFLLWKRKNNAIRDVINNAQSKNDMMQLSIVSMEQQIAERELQINNIKTQASKVNKDRIEDMRQSIRTHINANNLEQTLHWSNYELMVIDANLYMFDIVKKLTCYPNMSESNIRICIMTLLKMSLPEMASHLHRSPSSMKNLKYHTAKKLGTTSACLYDLLFDLMCNNTNY